MITPYPSVHDYLFMTKMFEDDGFDWDLEGDDLLSRQIEEEERGRTSIVTEAATSKQVARLRTESTILSIKYIYHFNPLNKNHYITFLRFIKLHLRSNYL